MSKIIALVAWLVASAGLVYLVGAFMVYSLDPADWGDGGRLFAVFAWGGVSMTAIAVVGTWRND